MFPDNVISSVLDPDQVIMVNADNVSSTSAILTSVTSTQPPSATPTKPHIGVELRCVHSCVPNSALNYVLTLK